MGIRWTWWVALTTAAGAISLFGCSGGDTRGSTATPVPQDQFSGQVAAAICDGLAGCCRTSGFAFDLENCRSAWQTAMSSEAPTSTAVVYDANAAGECLAALRQYVSACGTGTPSVTAGCDRVYVGTKPAGAACESDEECARPAQGYAYCDDTPIVGSDGGTSASPAVCVVDPPLVHGARGQGCSMTCTTDGSGGSCSASVPPVEGTPTPTPNVACFTDDGLYCSSSFTCQALGALGATCSGWGSCVDQAFCGAAGVCEAKKPDGQACSGAYDECLGYCSTSGICTTDTASFVSAEVCGSTYDID